MARENDLRSNLESLEARFQLVLKRYTETEIHDEKAKLVIVAKQIAREYRKQIAEYKLVLHLESRAVRGAAKGTHQADDAAMSA
jgi:ribosomal protein L30E